VPPFPSREALCIVFGQRVRARRIALQMRQEALATAVGYGNHTIIAKIEGGLNLPSLDKAVAIAGVLGVPLESLLQTTPRSGVEFPNLEQLLREEATSFIMRWAALLRALADDLDSQTDT
jgi:transcriptional regulator with XRE-family HTH domain